MFRKILFLTVLCMTAILKGNGQDRLALKTNLLYGGLTLTPNIGLEIGLGERSTLNIWGGYNPWNLDGSANDNKKLAHFIVQPEYRYWFCERFNGHFVGLHAFYSKYNISEHKIPLLLEKNGDKYRFKGDIYGAGVAYGYQFILNRSFNLEFTVGLGYGYMKYDKYEARRCGELLKDDVVRHYFGPTKAGITLVYLFN